MQHTRTSVAIALVGLVTATAALSGCDGRTPERADESVRTTGSARAVEADCAGTPADPVTHRYRELAGVDPDRTSLDVYAPADLAADAACPVVVFVHGGGWRRGDKSQGSVERKAEWLNDRGIVLVSANYRLAQPGEDVRWPDFGTDVAAAVAWVADHADEIGVDPARITLMGHSAGAHLVGIVATHPRLLADAGFDRSDVACVVELDTAADDLTDADRTAARLIASAFGDDPAVLADASPLVQAREHPGELAEFLLVTRGRPARRSSAAAFAEVLRAAGTTAEVADASPLGHAAVNRRLGDPDDDVVTPVVGAFLDGCTAPR